MKDMKELIFKTLKYFLFFFLVIEVIPYISKQEGSLKEIMLQTICLFLISAAIAIYSNKKK